MTHCSAATRVPFRANGPAFPCVPECTGSRGTPENGGMRNSRSGEGPQNHQTAFGLHHIGQSEIHSTVGHRAGAGRFSGAWSLRCLLSGLPEFLGSAIESGDATVKDGSSQATVFNPRLAPGLAVEIFPGQFPELFGPFSSHDCFNTFFKAEYIWPKSIPGS